jgi:hypothetical protein
MRFVHCSKSGLAARVQLSCELAPFQLFELHAIPASLGQMTGHQPGRISPGALVALTANRALDQQLPTSARRHSRDLAAFCARPVCLQSRRE